LLLGAGVEVYGGMIIGEHAKENDLDVNAVREKKLTNVRSSGAEEKLTLIPVQQMGLDQAIEWITDDDLVEATPNFVRIRCRELDPHKRKRSSASSAE
jgi:GTP-binding protein